MLLFFAVLLAWASLSADGASYDAIGWNGAGFSGVCQDPDTGENQAFCNQHGMSWHAATGRCGKTVETSLAPAPSPVWEKQAAAYLQQRCKQMCLDMDGCKFVSAPHIHNAMQNQNNPNMKNLNNCEGPVYGFHYTVCNYPESIPLPAGSIWADETATTWCANHAGGNPEGGPCNWCEFAATCEGTIQTSGVGIEVDTAPPYVTFMHIPDVDCVGFPATGYDFQENGGTCEGGTPESGGWVMGKEITLTAWAWQGSFEHTCSGVRGYCYHMECLAWRDSDVGLPERQTVCGPGATSTQHNAWLRPGGVIADGYHHEGTPCREQGDCRCSNGQTFEGHPRWRCWYNRPCAGAMEGDNIFITETCVGCDPPCKLGDDVTGHCTPRLDDSGNVAVRRVSNLAISSTTKKHGTGAYYFHGGCWNGLGNGDYDCDRLLIPDSVHVDLMAENTLHDTDKWTVDLWWRTTDEDRASQAILSKWKNSGDVTSVKSYLLRWENSKIRWYLGGTNSENNGFITDQTDNVGYICDNDGAKDTWYHSALVRNGGKITGYLNGVKCGETSDVGAVHDNNMNFVVGTDHDSFAAQQFLGYIDDVRVRKGIAAWTGNSFTPPSGTPEADPYTRVLLTAETAMDYRPRGRPAQCACFEGYHGRSCESTTRAPTVGPSKPTIAPSASPSDATTAPTVSPSDSTTAPTVSPTGSPTYGICLYNEAHPSEPVEILCRTLFVRSNALALHSYGPDPHSCAVLCNFTTGWCASITRGASARPTTTRRRTPSASTTDRRTSARQRA